MTRVTVLYFASLREASGIATEQVDSEATDLLALYLELQQRHGFKLPANRLRVAMQGDFAQWSDALREGSEIAFIPPVSGG